MHLVESYRCSSCRNVLVKGNDMSWPELDVVKSEKRRELTLSSEIDKRLSERGFPSDIYALTNLNHLEITLTKLESVPPGLCQLANLTSLVLHGNKLYDITDDLVSLSKLKTLDVSNNVLRKLPVALGTLPELQSLNCSSNCLEEFPSVGNLKLLHFIDISDNKLTSLPDGITSPELCHLAVIKASHNQINEIPCDLNELPHLKTLELSNNNIHVVPVELGECMKLKELDLKENKLSDQKLLKYANDNHCTTKTVLDYLALLQEKQSGGAKGKSKGKRKKKTKKDADDEENGKDILKIVHFPSNGGVVVTVSPAVLEVRPYIVCCVVRNLDLNKSSATFKKFIAFQTKLHEGVCEQRRAGTIATHDLNSVQLPLSYDAIPQQLIKITPLFRNKEFSATELMTVLRKEAENQRKEKKRSSVSGVYKYLDLLKDKELYPCLMDANGTVISFPQITNSDSTKMSAESRDLLLEVTSSSSLDKCKKIADSFLLELLDLGASARDPDSADDEVGATRKQLVVEQSKVFDKDGGLRVVYPSRSDLGAASSDIVIIRD